MSTPSTGPDVHFGVDAYVEGLKLRLKRHFHASADARGEETTVGVRTGPARGDQALVVGILGPWGCGKTTWLKRVQASVEREAHAEVAPVVPQATDVRQVTVPVFFNAWQFEKEPHLIIPLLKTAEASVRRFAARHEARLSDASKDGRKSVLAPTVRMLGDFVFALAYGMNVGFSLGFGQNKVSGGLSGKAAIDGWTQRRQARVEAQEDDDFSSAADAYESLYYDLLGFMRAITRPQTMPEEWTWLEQAPLRTRLLELEKQARDEEEGSDAREATTALIRKLQSDLESSKGNCREEFQINLLFLIDDLDRCLPEKAVEMLESIKLFLEAPGCAFVLGIDDEVVEHAIRHRYQDYRAVNNKLFAGSEYLEKLIQLPIRVPPISGHDARAFLLNEYPELFKPSSPRPRSRGESDEVVRARKDKDETLDRAMEEVLSLLVDVVPPVPRKLVRTAELFALLHQMAQERAWSAPHQYNPVLLARLTVLQLFAPAVFRLARHNYRRDFVEVLYELCSELNLARVIEQGAEEHAPAPGADEAALEKLRIFNRNRFRAVVATEVRGVLEERSEFDARDVVRDLESAERLRWSEGIGAHYRLVDDGQTAAERLVPKSDLRQVAVVDGTASSEAMVPQGAGATREPASPAPPPRLRARLRQPGDFLSLATSTDRRDWQSALAAESDALSGRVLGPDIVASLEQVASGSPPRFTRSWFETFLPYLDLSDVERLFRKAQLLDATARQDPTEAVRLLSMLCQHFNPPHAPPTHTVSVARLRNDNTAKLDLHAASMWDAYLVGLTDQSAAAGARS